MASTMFLKNKTELFEYIKDRNFLKHNGANHFRNFLKVIKDNDFADSLCSDVCGDSLTANEIEKYYFNAITKTNNPYLCAWLLKREQVSMPVLYDIFLTHVKNYELKKSKPCPELYVSLFSAMQNIPPSLTEEFIKDICDIILHNAVAFEKTNAFIDFDSGFLYRVGKYIIDNLDNFDAMQKENIPLFFRNIHFFSKDASNLYNTISNDFKFSHFIEEFNDEYDGLPYRLLSSFIGNDNVNAKIREQAFECSEINIENLLNQPVPDAVAVDIYFSAKTDFEKSIKKDIVKAGEYLKFFAFALKNTRDERLQADFTGLFKQNRAKILSFPNVAEVFEIVKNSFTSEKLIKEFISDTPTCFLPDILIGLDKRMVLNEDIASFIVNEISRTRDDVNSPPILKECFKHVEPSNNRMTQIYNNADITHLYKTLYHEMLSYPTTPKKALERALETTTNNNYKYKILLSLACKKTKNNTNSLVVFDDLVKSARILNGFLDKHPLKNNIFSDGEFIDFQKVERHIRNIATTIFLHPEVKDIGETFLSIRKNYNLSDEEINNMDIMYKLPEMFKMFKGVATEDVFFKYRRPDLYINYRLYNIISNNTKKHEPLCSYMDKYYDLIYDIPFIKENLSEIINENTVSKENTKEIQDIPR